MSQLSTYISDSEQELTYGVSARAIHYNDSDDDTISYESLLYENGLKQQFKTICQLNTGDRPTTPQIHNLAINNGGSITVYNNTNQVSSTAVSMATMSEQDYMNREMHKLCCRELIKAVWTGKQTAVKIRRGKVGFCL